MELFDLPAEVIHTIISQCDLSTLLQLRLVSKAAKTFVNTSTFFPEALQDVQITLHWSTLAKFIESAPRLPFSNFFIENSPIWFDQSQDASDFYKQSFHFQTLLTVFCPHIHVLRVQRMFGCKVNEEFEFFQTLRNLKELYIHELKFAATKNTDSGNQSKSQTRLPFTEPHLKIKRLDVHNEHDCGDYLIQLVKLCPSLEVTKVTRSIGASHLGRSYFKHSSINQRNDECYPYILRLGSEGHLKHLKRWDLDRKTFKMDACSPQDIQFFQKLLSNMKVCLENVSSSFVHEVLNCPTLPVETKEDLKQRIRSGHGMSELVTREGFINLQEVYFDIFNSWTHEGSKYPETIGTLQLPQLRKINAVLSTEDNLIEGAQELIECLFRPDEPRTTVTDLKIFYRKAHFITRDSPWTFQPSFLDAGFPNLTRLTFIEHTGNYWNHVQLCNLIQVISTKVLLQELSLSSHRGFPEVAFFGPGPLESPLFLKLKCLMKLRLNSDVRDPFYFTDTEKMGNRMMSFLSKMSLSYLQIVGGDWNNVTSGGIRKLVKGPFGRSVLKVRLESLEDTNRSKVKHSGAMERLARITHSNRVAKGLSSSSFEEFQAAEELLNGEGTHPFRVFLGSV